MRGRGALIGILCAVGCGPTMVSWPPPAAPATDDIPVERGQLDLGFAGAAPTLGPRPLVFTLPNPPYVFNLGWPMVNSFGGSAALGLTDDVTVRYRVAHNGWGANRGIEVSTRLNPDTLLFGGPSGGCYESSYSPDDDTGDAEPIPFAYCNAAVTVGAGHVFTLRPRLKATVRASLSGASTFAVRGLDQSRQGLWLNVAPGLVYGDVVQVGVGLGLQAGVGQTGANGFRYVPTASITVRPRVF